MARAKKQQYQKKSFESTGASNDTSANLYMSMLLSPAWRDLTANQQRLYLYCKAQYYAEKQKPIPDDPMTFTMNQSKWCALYGLYEKSNAKGFYRDMGELILHGFISCVECGAISRTKSIYKFSGKWRQFGTEAFVIAPTEMTIAMQRHQREKTK